MLSLVRKHKRAFVRRDSSRSASSEEYSWTRLVFDLLLLTIPLDVVLLALRCVDLKQSCEHMMLGYPVLTAQLAPADSPTAAFSRAQAQAQADTVSLPAAAAAAAGPSTSAGAHGQQSQQRANGLRGILKRPYAAGPDAHTRPLRSALTRSRSQSFADTRRCRLRAVVTFMSFVSGRLFAIILYSYC